jgi:Domain of unknown function (DUF4328)
MNLKPLAKLTRFLVVLLKVNTGLAFLAVVAGVYGWVEYSNPGPDVDASQTLLHSDITNSLTGLAQLFMTLFIGVTFLRWIFRASKNLHVLSSEPMAFTPGWAVGWFFIPFANLYKPTRRTPRTMPNNPSPPKEWQCALNVPGHSAPTP